MLAVIGLLLAAGPVQAYDTYLLNGADYATAGNWSSAAIPAGVAADIGVVGGYNSATLATSVSGPSALYIGYDTTGSLDLSGSASLAVGSTGLYLGYTATGAGNLTVNAGAFSNSGGSYLGYVSGASGTATLNNGTWSNSGSFNAGNFNVGYVSGGTGTFNVYGGVFSTTARLMIGTNGTGFYNQTAGSASIWQFCIGANPGGIGTATISGGTVTTTNDCKIGCNQVVGSTGPPYTQGTLNLQGTAIMTSNEVSVGGDQHYCNGVVNLSGNASWTDTGKFYIARGNVSTADYSNGTVTQTGGTLTVTGMIGMGDEACNGYYGISGGVLNANGGLTLGSASGASGLPGVEGVALSGSGSISVTNLTVGANSYNQATFTQSGGTMTVSGALYVNYGDNTTTGSLTQSGGLTTVTGNVYIGYSSGLGTYTANGGLLQITNSSSIIYVGYGAGGGLLAIGVASPYTAGSVTTTGAVCVGYTAGGTGTINQTDGYLQVGGNMYVGGSATTGAGGVTQSGGLSSVAGTAYIGYAGVGSFALSGGTASLATCYVAYGAANGTLSISNTGVLNFTNSLVAGNGTGTATVTQTGGIVTTTNWLAIGAIAGSTGAYTIGAGATLNANGGGLYVCDYGNGTFTQNGGTVNANASCIGTQSGTTGIYTINDGVFNVTGGTTDIGLEVGDWGGATGTLNIYGGTINATYATFGKNGGVGVVNQTAGVVTVSGDTYLGGYIGTIVASTGSGTYNLGGTGIFTTSGALYVGYRDAAGAASAFNQTGGMANLGGNISGIGTYSLSGGQLAMNAHNISGVALGFSGGTITDATTVSSNITLASGTGAVFQQSGTATTTTVSGAIFGNGQLIQAGLGTLDLTGSALSYSGTTTIASGTLKAAYASFGALASAPVNVQSSTSTFLINYTGTAQSTADATVQSILAASYNSGGGHFASGTIYSPTATAAAKALGWNDNNSNQITVAYTVYGDANLDGAVNGADLGAVLANFGSTNGTWYMGDFNYDGSVNGADLGVVLANFGQHVSVTAAVPEPSTLLLSAAGLVSLLAYAWRKRK